MSEELKFSMPIVNEIPKWVIPTWCLSEKGKRGETVATVITFGTHIEQLTKLSKKEYERGRLATIKEERERILNLLTYYGKWLNMSNKRIFRIDLDEIKAKELLGAE